MTDNHEHEWLPLGNLQVCTVSGCSAHRATTRAVESVLERLGDTTRETPNYREDDREGLE